MLGSAAKSRTRHAFVSACNDHIQTTQSRKTHEAPHHPLIAGLAFAGSASAASVPAASAYQRIVRPMVIGPVKGQIVYRQISPSQVSVRITLSGRLTRPLKVLLFSGSYT
jgi:hypothetical protein